jgi:hypothetical protein
MLRIIALVGVLAAAGCAPSQVEQAEQEYRIVQKHGKPEDKCTAARKVAEAYLHARNAERYHAARVDASIQCLAADMEYL